MANALGAFKTQAVQQPQRRRAALRSVLEQHRKSLDIVVRTAAKATMLRSDARELPSSKNGSFRRAKEVSLSDEVRRIGAIVDVISDSDPSRPKYEIRPERHDLDVVAASPALLEPTVLICGKRYRLRYVEARTSDPPIIVKNRPREIVFNLSHEIFDGRERARAVETLFTLELAYLLGRGLGAEDLYDGILEVLTGSGC